MNLHQQSTLKDNWISVEDSLPESGNYFAIWIKGYNMPEIATYDSEHQVFTCMRGTYGLDKVTHWMPVVEPN